ncbi:hypothetical protein [uncultured Tyzzerella sp.]|uniref:hypothetical protein n=1 Tax=uncultured Tyzzerella sp. TaxID=2321398 RepID=UPI0029426F11|nr:hypothetical protein [uncultured Tyzzerella sp.]
MILNKNNIFVKVKNKIKDNRGVSTTIIGAGKIFFILFIFYLIYTMTSIISLVTNSRELIESATVQTIQRNYAKLYHTSRESYSGGYRPDGNDFYESYIEDETSIINNLTKNDMLTYINNDLVKVSKNREKLYSISNIKVDINNEPIRSGTKKFIMTTRYNFEYPITIFGHNFDVSVPMKVKAKHTAKY